MCAVNTSYVHALSTTRRELVAGRNIRGHSANGESFVLLFSQDRSEAVRDVQRKHPHSLIATCGLFLLLLLRLSQPVIQRHQMRHRLSAGSYKGHNLLLWLFGGLLLA